MDKDIPEVVGVPGGTQHANTMQIAVAKCMGMEIFQWIMKYAADFRELYQEDPNRSPQQFADLLKEIKR